MGVTVKIQASRDCKALLDACIASRRTAFELFRRPNCALSADAAFFFGHPA